MFWHKLAAAYWGQASSKDGTLISNASLSERETGNFHHGVGVGSWWKLLVSRTDPDHALSTDMLL